MPFIPTPAGVVRIRAHWLHAGGATAENIWYLNATPGSTPTEGDLELSIGVMGNALAPTSVTGPINVMSSEWTLTRIDAEDAASADGFKTSQEFTTTGGRAGAQPVPPGCAVVSRWDSGHRGRSAHGRTFWVGAVEGQVDGSGKIATSELSDWQDASFNFIQQAKDNTSLLTNQGLYIASFYHPNPTPPPSSAPRAVAVLYRILDTQVATHVHSQRRRNPVG